MIKYECDRCKKQFEQQCDVSKVRISAEGNKWGVNPFVTSLDLCPDCLELTKAFLRAAIRKARCERYCHSEYGSANCKWEPGVGCTPKCPECIPIGGDGMTHTPGPWKVLCGDVVLECNEKEVVAWVGNIDGQMINNAHLIAAAPEMLAVLEKLSSLLVDGEEYVPLELREELTTAIRKARGEV